MAELTTLARPYAKAAFEYALSAKALVAWSESLAFASAVASDAQIQLVLKSPALTAIRKSEIFIDICEGKLDEKVKSFINTLSVNNRLPLLPVIFKGFEKLRLEEEAMMEVSITSAFELSEGEKTKLLNALKARFNKDINMVSDIEKGLIGGLVIRAGDLVIDGSIRGRIQKLTEAMNS
ncbi:MAG: F0F1 ATP synthase subunit delta [Pseudomonadales bacterium]|nr:F0F1 ATP synthase subunit delta [Pseudomonadales bacterium]